MVILNFCVTGISAFISRELCLWLGGMLKVTCPFFKKAFFCGQLEFLHKWKNTFILNRGWYSDFDKIIIAHWDALFLSHKNHFTSLQSNALVIVSPDESRGYLGFSTVTPPPQRFPFGRDNLKNILVRTLQCDNLKNILVRTLQCHERYCFVTLTFNLKVTGGLLKVRCWPFFTFLPSSPIQKVRSSYGWYI